MRIQLAAGVLALGVLVSGCGGSPEKPAAQTNSDEATQHGRFIQAVSGKTTVEPEVAYRAARETCTSLDNGATVITTYRGMAERYGSTDGGFIVGAAVAGLCPSHRDQLDAAIKLLREYDNAVSPTTS